MKTHRIHGRDGIEICSIEETNPANPYKIPARDVAAIKFDEDEEPCFQPGDVAYWGMMGGTHSPEYPVFFNVSANGEIDSFQSLFDLRYWYSERDNKINGY